MLKSIEWVSWSLVSQVQTGYNTSSKKDKKWPFSLNPFNFRSAPGPPEDWFLQMVSS